MTGKWFGKKFAMLSPEKTWLLWGDNPWMFTAVSHHEDYQGNIKASCGVPINLYLPLLLRGYTP